MFSILSNKLTYSDLKTSVENARQTRPFEVVRTGSSSNRSLTPGYKGTTILKDSYYFENILFDTYIPLQPGDRILFYGQTNPIENGIWNVMSIIQENKQFVNIQRPADYAKNTPIRSGQYLLIAEGATLSGNIYKNTTPEYDSNENKIIAYNGTSPQYWQYYTKLSIQVLKPIAKVTLYTGYNFTGNNQEFDIGDYPFVNISGYDNISSIKIPFGYKVILYNRFFYGSYQYYIYNDEPRSLELTSDVSDLSLYNFDNITQSLKISSIIG